MAAVGDGDLHRCRAQTRHLGFQRVGLQRVRRQVVERQRPVVIGVVGQPLRFADRVDLQRAPRNDQLGAIHARAHPQRSQYKGVLRARWRRQDVASHAADRTRRCHDRDRAAVELVVGGDDNAVDVVDADAGVVQRMLGHRVQRLFQ
ncbi:MAG: hypothetical protein EBY24_05520 [Betaproteobacteria bacterium]|nr:hypothetical protein [Betaproteobacteria bacterium]